MKCMQCNEGELRVTVGSVSTDNNPRAMCDHCMAAFNVPFTKLIQENRLPIAKEIVYNERLTQLGLQVLGERAGDKEASIDDSMIKDSISDLPTIEEYFKLQTKYLIVLHIIHDENSRLLDSIEKLVSDISPRALADLKTWNSDRNKKAVIHQVIKIGE